MVSHHGTTAAGNTPFEDTTLDRTAPEHTPEDRTTYDGTTDERATDERMTDMRTTDDRTTDERTATADTATDERTADEYAVAEHREPIAAQEPVELYPVSTTAGDSPLFSTEHTENFQVEWRALQSEFVDDPREAVQRADELVTQVIQTLAATFAEHKSTLEEQWREGDEVQTEELRQALKRYRAFFDRLLAV